MSKKKQIRKKKREIGKTRKYFLFYTILFLWMVWIVFHYFWENDRTFVWVPDGAQQHYRALMYYSKWLKELFSGIFVRHTLSLPAYSFSIGYGADILTTLHYYVIGDPLNLFCVFVPDQHMLNFYEFLILFRFYLAGAAFSGYCFYRKKNASGYGGGFPSGTDCAAVLAGGFLYIFCSYALFAGVRHPYFINPMIYLPLLLTGVERLWCEKKPGLFIGGVFLSVISNFYFFYMLVVLVVIYVVIRLCAAYGPARWKQMGRAVLELAGYALVGVAAGAVILLPVILMFLTNSRLDTGYRFDFLYNGKYYKAFLPDMLTAMAPGNWTLLGYAAPAIPALFSLFAEVLGGVRKIRIFGNRTDGAAEEKKRKREPDKRESGMNFSMNFKISRGALAAGFLLLTLFLLFPAAGYAMNGFAYVANRWVWGYSMLIAFIVVNEWETLIHIRPGRFGIVAALTAGYALLCIILRKNISEAGRENLKLSLILLALCLVCLAVCCFWEKKKAGGLGTGNKKWIPQFFLCLIVLVNIGGTAYFRYSAKMGNYISDFRKRSQFQKLYEATEAGAVQYAARNETGFFRYTGQGLSPNSTLESALSSTQFYWSLSNGNIWEYFTEQELTEHSSFNYTALDDRAALCALAGVKYYVEKRNGTGCVPYGFREVELPKEYGKKYAVYENSLSLAPGFTYDNYILREDYEALDALERQEAMLQGAVLSEKADGFESAALFSTAQEMDFTIDYADGKIKREGDCFIVKKKDAELVLHFDGPAGCETYLELKGLYYDWGKTQAQKMTLTVTAEDALGARVEKQFKHKGAFYTFYNGKHDYAVHLGYSENKRVSVSIRFPKKGEYRIESIRIVCQPMALYEEAVKKLNGETLDNMDCHNENPAAATDRVTGEITLQKPKILVLSVPYSKGWKAFVDGKEQTLLQANTMFCALVLEEGSHQIELRYRTPGLAAGGIISLAGIGIWIVIYKKTKQVSIF